MRKYVQALRCHSLRAGTFVRCESDNAVSCGRKAATRAAFPPCCVYYAPLRRRSRRRRAGINGKRYAASSRASPSAHCIQFCPWPRRGNKRPGTSLRFNDSGSSPRLNIIPSGLCNRSLGPQPHRLFPLPHTIRIMLSGCVCAL